jgi:hypothetical protein
MGEIAAVFAAGYISSAEAITAAYYRGYVVGKHTMDAVMMAAGMSHEAAEEAIAVAGVWQNQGCLCQVSGKCYNICRCSRN